MNIDLHIHSMLSDGTDSPKSIVDKAKDLGIKLHIHYRPRLYRSDKNCERLRAKQGYQIY